MNLRLSVESFGCMGCFPGDIGDSVYVHYSSPGQPLDAGHPEMYTTRYAGQIWNIQALPVTPVVPARPMRPQSQQPRTGRPTKDLKSANTTEAGPRSHYLPAWNAPTLATALFLRHTTMAQTMGVVLRLDLYPKQFTR